MAVVTAAVAVIAAAAAVGWSSPRPTPRTLITLCAVYALCTVLIMVLSEWIDDGSVRAKVEHPFRVIKRQFGLMKVRFRGLAKNTAHVVTLQTFHAFLAVGTFQTGMIYSVAHKRRAAFAHDGLLRPGPASPV